MLYLSRTFWAAWRWPPTASTEPSPMNGTICRVLITPEECVIPRTGRAVGASSSTSILGLWYGRRTTPASQPRPNEHPEVVYHCAPCVYTVHTMHTVHTTRTLCTLRVHCAHCAPPIHPNACNGHISATIYRFAMSQRTALITVGIR